MSRPFRTLVGNRDRLTASEWNRLANLGMKLERSLFADGFEDSGGIYKRHTVGVVAKQICRAFCKTNAGAATTIVCFLDVDATGEEITVNSKIAGGGNLDSAIPYLTDGLEVYVWKDGDDWKFAFDFQAINKDKGLDFDENKKLYVKLDECA